MLVAVFGPSAVQACGALGMSLEARGMYRGSPMRVHLEMAQTQRAGVQPFTTIEREDDLDVSVFSGGAAWPYPSHEPFVPFAPPGLADQAVAGAPRTLLVAIATGPIAEHLAAGGIERLSLGFDAKRYGCRTRGVHLVVAGWPSCERSLVFLLDTVAELGDEARRALGHAGPAGYVSGGRHPEVVAYEVARAGSRATGLKIAIFAVVAVTLLTMLGTVGLVIAMMRN